MGYIDIIYVYIYICMYTYMYLFVGLLTYLHSWTNLASAALHYEGISALPIPRGSKDNCSTYMAVSMNEEPFFLRVLIVVALLFGVCMRAPDILETPT